MLPGQQGGYRGQARDHLIPVRGPQGLPQLDLGRDLLAFALSVQPILDLGERVERTVRAAPHRCGEVVVASAPVGDSGPGDPGQPSDLRTGDKRADR